MRASSYRLLSILGSLALLVAALLVYTNMVVPAYNQVQMMRGEQVGIQETITQDKAAVSTVQNLVGQYQTESQLEDNISQILPTDPDVPDVVNQIQGLASANTLTLQSLAIQYLPIQAVSSQELIDPVGTIQLNISLSGQYDNFKSFLQGLETNIRLMDVSSIHIDGGGSTTGNGNLSYSLIVDTYYQEQPTTQSTTQ